MLQSRKIVLVFCFFLALGCFSQEKLFSLRLSVTDSETNVALENAQITISSCDCGGVTDKSGNLIIDLPSGRYKIDVFFLGYQGQTINVELNTNQYVEVLMQAKEEKLSEVIVRAKVANENIDRPQMGTVRLTEEVLKKLPSALGEFDVLRGMTLLPGINTAGDVSNGLTVRGGSLDQNLILYDYAPIFNPTHLYGLVSVFTPEMVSSVDLYRSNIPSKYGGRVTSVMDVKTQTPYISNFKMRGGIGLASSRLFIETPLKSDKLLLAAGVRAGFTDFLLPLFSKRLKNTKANFYDGTFKLLYLPNENNQISFTGFLSDDFYQLDLVSTFQNVVAENNQYRFKTFNGTLKWQHSFDETSNLATVLVGSIYDPRIIFPELGSNNEIEYRSGIDQIGFILELNKRVNQNLDYFAGLNLNRYVIHQGELAPNASNSILPVKLEDETSYELSGYANTNYKLNKVLTLSTGLRLNHYFFVGPHTSAQFDTNNTLIDITEFEKNEKVASYTNLEPRLGLVAKVDDNTSFKASYAIINQYLQNVYNSTSPLPTSRWKSADLNIRPQAGSTYSAGIFKNFSENNFEIGLEGYYRNTENVLTYKPGADFFLEEFLNQDIVQAEGKAYGIEFSLHKKEGSVNGWLNYTWSRSFLKSFNESLGDRINNNDWFASDFDRPHVFNGTVNFEGDKYNTVSFNFTAQSGRPYTIPNGVITVDNIDVPIFLDRNNARLPWYHRLDFSWNVYFSRSKENKRWENDWTFTIYNVYGRTNPVNSFFTSRTFTREDIRAFGGSPLGAYEISILNSPLFSLTYNFKFQ